MRLIMDDGTAVELCACGSQKHPLYGDRCEDCYADAMQRISARQPVAGHRLPDPQAEPKGASDDEN